MGWVQSSETRCRVLKYTARIISEPDIRYADINRVWIREGGCMVRYAGENYFRREDDGEIVYVKL